MIVFGAKSAEQVLAEKKTITLRKWPKAKVKVGETYDVAKMGYPPKKFGKVNVTGLSKVKLGAIGERLAKCDGAESAAEVKAYWGKQGFAAKDELWLVEFELIRWRSSTTARTGFLLHYRWNGT